MYQLCSTPLTYGEISAAAPSEEGFRDIFLVTMFSHFHDNSKICLPGKLILEIRCIFSSLLMLSSSWGVGGKQAASLNDQPAPWITNCFVGHHLELFCCCFLKGGESQCHGNLNIRCIWYINRRDLAT